MEMEKVLGYSNNKNKKIKRERNRVEFHKNQKVYCIEFKTYMIVTSSLLVLSFIISSFLVRK